MQWGIDIAEKLIVPIYLESTQAALPLYEGIGFQRIRGSIVQKPDITGLEHDVEVPLFYKMPKNDTAWNFEKLLGERRNNNNGTETRKSVTI
jgi:hypothetical protein